MEMSMSKILLTLLLLGIIVMAHSYSGTSEEEQEGDDHEQINDLHADPDEFDFEDSDEEEIDEASKRVTVNKQNTRLVLDFEQDTHKDYFVAANSTESVVTSVSKNGAKSLLWTWTTTSTIPNLRLNLPSNEQVTGSELRNGGFKFWMYRASKTPLSQMQIIFHGLNSSKSSPTDVELNFQGWRAVWISYKEFDGNDFPLTRVSSIEFVLKSPVSPGNLNIDLVQFSKRLSAQSRDLVVRQVGRTGPQANDALPHDDKAFWQQTLRWHLSSNTRSTANVTNVTTKINEIDDIEDRLDNWYAKVDEPINSLSANSSSGSQNGFDVNAMKIGRWNSLKREISRAHERYALIDFVNNRPPLFTKVSDYGVDDITNTTGSTTKLGFVCTKILLPLSLEYSLLSRTSEVQYLGKTLCKDLNSTNMTTKDLAIQKVAGTNAVMITKFGDIVKKGATGMTCSDDTNTRNPAIENLINQFNNFRLGRIVKLLKYLQNQGFAFGSLMGSFDHEMNKVGSGFMHSMFLLRKSLKTHADIQFDDLLQTMKWYCDFNEIYQPENDYVYDGTTADRMRTILLYRLMIILMEPQTTTAEKKNKIRDMNHFKTWFKHAIKINKGLGGVLKPDFTGFHHKTFYGSAYVPQAWHNAALVQYFLSGTQFALDTESKNNLRKALEVLRMVAVKYSTPNGVCGRFPSYTKAILSTQFPPYAYISYVHPKKGVQQPLDRPEMFLRLFDPANPAVLKYLKSGAPRSYIHYWNTIGALDVFENVATNTCASGRRCVAEASPSGHWSKNFAALSIHRRNDWSVAAKGFGKYSWDYEGNEKENAYGTFQSHGSLQISNSEDALKTYDVDNGWDWTKIPGTTAIHVPDLDEIKTEARNYNYRGFAGGVRFIGISSSNTHPKQGAFGMLFKKPVYIKKNISDYPLQKLKEFRKSYFFYNELIVCLGSDIKFVKHPTNSTSIYAQTTLFQDIKLQGSSKIVIDGTDRLLNQDYTHTWNSQSNPVNLKDTQGNTYKVKLASDNKLHVQISLQNSKTEKDKSSSGRYATAWLEHTKLTSKDSTRFDPVTTNPTETTETFKYEYAILINGGADNMLSKYQVFKQDTSVHAIVLNGLFSDARQKVYGYSFFSDTTGTPMTSGPVRSVDAPCMVMAEKKGKTLKISLADHNFRFEYNPDYSTSQTCTRPLRKNIPIVFRPKSNSDSGVKLMFCVRGKRKRITLTLESEALAIQKVFVEGKQKVVTRYAEIVASNQKQVIFRRLFNGFTTEIELMLI